jgi:hypothetical protein
MRYALRHTMNYDDFTTELAAIKLSGREFAKLLKLNQNTIANYKRTGKVPAHLAVIVVLIRKLDEAGIPYREVIEKLELLPNRARGKAIG